MKKRHLITNLLLFLGVTTSLHAQTGYVGIGTNIPQAKLHVNGELRIDTLKTTTDANKILVIDTVTKNIAVSSYPITIGDIKSSILAADHNGWIKLDGRLFTTLTTTQQTEASNLGLSGNLPDATNAYLSQNGGTLGTTSGSNVKVIAQNQLPNVTLGTSSSGSHKHSIKTTYNSTNDTDSQGYPRNDNHKSFRTTDRNDRTETGSSNELILNGGSHTHTTTSINGGVSQQSIDISPKTLSINIFIYLGN
jgi:hypothetical protein